MEATAREVMTTDLISVTPATPVAEFARICAEDGISGAPVVTVDGRLVGIVSKTDLLPRLLEGKVRARAADMGAGVDLDDDFDAMAEMASESDEEVLGTVDEIMQGEVVTVPPDAPLSTVAKRMARDRIHRVIVVEDERIRGIITSLDLLGRFAASEGATAPSRKAGRTAAARKPTKRPAAPPKGTPRKAAKRGATVKKRRGR